MHLLERTSSLHSPGRVALFGVSFLVLAVSVGLLATPYWLLAPLPGLTLMLVLLMRQWPELAFYGIVFLIPYGTYRSLAGGLKIHWILGFYLLCILALQATISRSLPSRLKSSIWSWFLLFLSVNAIASLFSAYPDLAWRNMTLLLVGGLYIALSMAFVDESNYDSYLPQTLIWSVGISSFMAVLGYYFNIALFAEDVDSGFKRGLGGAPDPNNAALMIIFTLPLLSYWFMTTQRHLSRMVVLLLATVNILALVTTFSRSGVIVLGLTFLAMSVEWLRHLRPNHFGFLGIALFAALVVSYAIIPQSYWERQLSLIQGKSDFSIDRRTSYLLVAWKSFKESPVIGKGTGVFEEIYGGSRETRVFSKEGQSGERPAHNTYAEILVGSGVLGLILFLGMIVTTIRNFTKAAQRLRRDGSHKLALLTRQYRISFCSALLFLVFFSDIHHKYLLLSFGLSQAALTVAGQQEVSRP